jgi:hypothetical protein
MRPCFFNPSDHLLANDPTRAGDLAAGVERFGPGRRYALYPVHTRFDALAWMVEDSARLDPVTGLPAVIRQGETRRATLESLGGPFDLRAYDRGIYAGHLAHAMFVREVYVLAGQREADAGLYAHNKQAYRRSLVDARKWRPMGSAQR